MYRKSKVVCDAIQGKVSPGENMEILLLGSIIFAPLAFGAVEPWAFGLLHAVFFGMAAYIFITGRAHHPNPLYKNLLPAVLIVAAIGMLQAIIENPVSAPSNHLFTVWRPATLNAVVTWLFYAAVLYCVPQIITTPKRLKRLLWIIFIMGVFIALMGMLQMTVENKLVYGLRLVGGDPFGPFINHNHGASFLIISMMAGFGLFFSSFRMLAARQGHARFFDLLAVQFLKLVMIMAVAYGIYITGSRGGLHSVAFAAAAVGFISAGFIKTKKNKIAAYAGLIVLLAGYGLFISQNKILIGLKDDDKYEGSSAGRLSMYKSGQRMFLDFPAFGVGLGAAEYAFPHYKLPDLPKTALVRYIHSDWLQIMLEVGFIGGLIYLAGLLAAVYFFLRIWIGARSFTIKALCGGALGAIVADSVHNLVEFSSHIPANALVFYVILGALASKPAMEDPPRGNPEYEEPPALNPPLRRYAAPAAALAVLLSACVIPQVIAWRYDQLAKIAPFRQKLEFRAISLKWAPNPQSAFRLGGDYYNQGLKDKTAPCEFFKQSRQTIAPYLRRVPVNYDLNRLDESLRLQLAHCHNPLQI